MPSQAVIKVLRTEKWATTMTKWRIAFEVGGRRLGSSTVKAKRRWQLVGFPGPAGRESAGIVDLIAIRKDHGTPDAGFERGDLFEIILIQVKGGSAPRPSPEDVNRLWAVAERYRAKAVMLAEWKKGGELTFSTLRTRDGRPDFPKPWEEIDPGTLFR